MEIPNVVSLIIAVYVIGGIAFCILYGEEAARISAEKKGKTAGGFWSEIWEGIKWPVAVYGAMRHLWRMARVGGKGRR